MVASEATSAFDVTLRANHCAFSLTFVKTLQYDLYFMEGRMLFPGHFVHVQAAVHFDHQAMHPFIFFKS